MLLRDLLQEMPVRAKGALGAKFTARTLPYSELDKFFIIETDRGISLLLDDEDNPKEILFANIDDDDSIVTIVGRLILGNNPFVNILPHKTIVEHIITIDDGYKGQGIGAEVYKSLIDNGFTIVSDSVHFEDAFWFWKKLIKTAPKLGIKVYLIKDNSLVRNRDGNLKFITTRTPESLIWDLGTDRIVLTRRTLQ